MKNPVNRLNLFLVEFKDKKDLVSIAYTGKSGMVRAFHGFGDTRLAYVGGGGYDKIGTCLDTAIQTLTQVSLSGNGAAGVNSVIAEAKKKGIRVVDVLANAINL